MPNIPYLGTGKTLYATYLAVDLKLMTMFESSPEGIFGFEGRTLELRGGRSTLLTPPLSLLISPLSWVRTAASTGAVARTGVFW